MTNQPRRILIQTHGQEEREEPHPAPVRKTSARTNPPPSGRCLPRCRRSFFPSSWARRHNPPSSRPTPSAGPRRDEMFRTWVKNLRSGQLFKLGESQLEQDFTTGLLHELGYCTQGQVLAAQPWSTQPKWSFPNAGTADVVLGRFETDAEGHLTPWSRWSAS